MTVDRAKWYLKQLLPLHYCTLSRPHFPDLPADHPDQDQVQFVRWRMWLGRSFRVVRTPAYLLAPPIRMR